MNKSEIWDIQTRIFHWSLTLLIMLCIIISGLPAYIGISGIGSDRWLNIHVAAGTCVALLAVFRIFWGFAGSGFSRFHAFRFRISELVGYLASFRGKGHEMYAGHNPAASWFTVTSITLCLFIAATGAVVYGIQESRGPLKGLYRGYFQYADLLKDMHIACVLLLVAAITLHMLGVLIDAVKHKKGAAAPSIITGVKLLETPVSRLRPNRRASILSVILLLLPFLTAYYVYAGINSYKPIVSEHPSLYVSECGSCHMAYPPNMLPEKSWEKMMAGLDNHFGDDAAIEPDLNKEIKNYLVMNSAEKSMEEFSIKVVKSVDKEQPPQSATEIGYWKKKHDKISLDVFKHESVKSKSNCVACHKWAEYGSFEDNDIKLRKKAVYAKTLDKKDNISGKSDLLALKNLKDKRL